VCLEKRVSHFLGFLKKKKILNPKLFFHDNDDNDTSSRVASKPIITTKQKK